MQLIIKNFHELTTTELYELLKVRAAVFVVEQDCVYQDMDDVDYRSLHIFMEEEGSIQAYLRVFQKDAQENIVQIGRVLTTKRGVGLGEEILKAGIEAAKACYGARKICIEAQVYAIGFYERVGFKVVSEEFQEDGIPHVVMEWEEEER